jgi:hypothetical protein
MVTSGRLAVYDAPNQPLELASVRAKLAELKNRGEKK